MGTILWGVSEVNNWSEWIEWKGGELPVDDKTLVQVMLHDGAESDILPARNFYWGSLGSAADVAAYRYKLPNQPEVTTEEDEAWEEAEKRMDAIGQNGNTGEHYEALSEPYELPNDGTNIKELVSDFFEIYNKQKQKEIEERHKETLSKYHVEIKPGVWVDVYDVCVAWSVINPALQHLLKKVLLPGERGHKTREQDLQDIIDSAVRAKELEG